MKQLLKWRFHGENRCGKSVNQIHSSSERIWPVSFGNGGFGQKSKTSFDYMMMFALREPVVFWCMRRGSEMGDSLVSQKISESNELATVVGIKGSYFCVETIFD